MFAYGNVYWNTVTCLVPRPGPEAEPDSDHTCAPRAEDPLWSAPLPCM